MKRLLDFDDAGAGNDEPAKGVTVGNIRVWFDERADMMSVLHEVEGYLNDRADVDDGMPDAAMRLLVEVKAVIAKATGPD